MAVRKRSRWILIAPAAVVVLLIGSLIGTRVAAGALKSKVVAVLGPTSEIKDIRVGWTSVIIEGLRIKGPSGWPTDDALQAERVTIVPSLLSLFSPRYRVRSITIDKPYLSVLQTEEGKIQILPGLVTGLPKEGQTEAISSLADASPLTTIRRITLRDGVVELFDAMVSTPPAKIRLEQIKTTMRDIAVPGLMGKSHFELTGVVKGVRQDGQVEMEGWAEVETKDSSVKTELRSVDILVLQPYLVKAGETSVQSGVFDFDLQSDVSHRYVNAAGKAILSDLTLVPAESGFDTMMGLPRQAMLAFLNRHENQIRVDYGVEGDFHNLKMSIEQFATARFAVTMAKAFGVRLGGATEDVGNLGQKSRHAVKATASWFKRLFTGKEKR